MAFSLSLRKIEERKDRNSIDLFENGVFGIFNNLSRRLLGPCLSEGDSNCFARHCRHGRRSHYIRDSLQRVMDGSPLILQEVQTVILANPIDRVVDDRVVMNIKKVLGTRR
jgi:hypothetical protein